MSKISELSDGGSLQSTDYLVAVRSGGNVKARANGDLTLGNVTLDGLEVVDTNPIVQIRDSTTSAGSAAITLRMGESDGSGNIENYWDIKVNGATGALEFIDNWSGSGGTGTRMVIDDSGSLLVGTTFSASGTPKISVNGSVQTLWGDYRVGAVFDNSFRQGMYFDSTNRNMYLFSTTSDTGGNIVFSTRNAAGSSDDDYGTERMRLDDSGNLLVGTTTNYPGVSGLGGNIKGMMSEEGGSLFLSRVDSNPVLYINRGGTDGDIVRFSKDASTVGSISVTASVTAYNTSSDARLKENIADAEDAGAKVDAIQVRQFDWKVDGSHQDYGMIAQELMTVAPEAVSGDPESDDMMGVDYSKLVPMMLKEIQSLRARVAQLEQA